MPNEDHVPVNTNVDAWYLPPTRGDARRFTMLYVPEALNELGFLLTLVFVLAAAFWWRRLPGPG